MRVPAPLRQRSVWASTTTDQNTIRKNQEVEAALEHSGTDTAPYLVFRPVAGGPANNFFNLNWVEFGGQGISVP
jgi:hypothetical protein